MPHSGAGPREAEAVDQEIISQADLRQGEWLEDVCAFANAQGGSVLIEAPDSRRGNPALEALELAPLRIYEELGITCEVGLVMVGGHMGVEVTVPPFPQPVSYDGRFFQRSHGQTVLLVGDELVRFLRGRDSIDAEVPWERRPVPQARPENLDVDAIAFLWEATRARRAEQGRGEDDGQSDDGWERPLDDDPQQRLISQLRALDLLDEATGYLTNAGALLVHRAPHQVAEGALIRVGFFDAGGEPLASREVTGPLLSQVDQAVELILFQRKEQAGGRMARVARSPLPALAVREALMNALVHKDYASGVPVQVGVSPQAVTVTNVGRPPERWTDETLAQPHGARPGNPHLAAVLARAGAVESWGTGILRMTSACDAAGLAAPTLTLSADEFSARLPQTPPPVDPLRDERLSRVDQQVLERLARDDRPTAGTVAHDLQVSDSTVRRSIRRLLKLGLIKRVGSSKAGFWQVNREEAS